jgi:hypothetical protein
MEKPYAALMIKVQSNQPCMWCQRMLRETGPVLDKGRLLNESHARIAKMLIKIMKAY